MLPWQPNKMAIGHKTQNWVDNHPMIITAKYGSHHFPGYGENSIKPFSHYKFMGAFCCHGTQTKTLITIILAELSLPKQHLYKIRFIVLQWFWRSSHLKNSFFKI